VRAVADEGLGFFALGGEIDLVAKAGEVFAHGEEDGGLVVDDQEPVDGLHGRSLSNGRATLRRPLKGAFFGVRKAGPVAGSRIASSNAGAMTPPRRILLVDDSPSIRLGIRSFLEDHGFSVSEAENVRGALEALGGDPPDAAVIDYMLPDGTALDILP